MSQTLRVVTAFGPFAVNQIISDPGQVAAILGGDYAADVTDAAGSGSSGQTGSGSGSGTGSGSSGGSGSGSPGTSGGLAPVSYLLVAVTSYVATHAFPYPPRAWLIDATGTEVETDVSYGPAQVTLTFPAPFTGTLWLG